MKMPVIGVKKVQGIAKVSGDPFTITRLLCLVPVENVNLKSVQISGFGSEVAELELAPEALAQFGKLTPGNVQLLDLATETRHVRGKFETVVVGLVGQPNLAAIGK